MVPHFKFLPFCPLTNVASSSRVAASALRIGGDGGSLRIGGDGGGGAAGASPRAPGA